MWQIFCNVYKKTSHELSQSKLKCSYQRGGAGWSRMAIWGCSFSNMYYPHKWSIYNKDKVIKQNKDKVIKQQGTGS